MVTAEATFNALGDGSFNQLVTLTRGGDFVPHLETISLLFRQDDHAGIVLSVLEKNVDLVARPAQSLCRRRRGTHQCAMVPSDL